MTQTRITCPQCQATLKLPANAPAGAKPKCPRCGTSVAVSSLAVAGISSMRVGSASFGDNGQASAVVSAAPSVGPLVAFGIIAGTMGLLVVMASVLLAVCFMEEGPLPEPVVRIADDDDGPGPAPVVTPKKAAPKKAADSQKGFVLSAADERKVDNAKRKGVEFLRKVQLKQGPEAGAWHGHHTTVGQTALVGLTLLESNVPASDPAVLDAATFVRRNVNTVGQNYETYAVSVSILFLIRLDDSADRPLIRSLALRLTASQYASGRWSYLSPPLKDYQEEDMLRVLKDYRQLFGNGLNPDSLTGKQLRAFPVVDYDRGSMVTPQVSVGDNSNTQFALLALWAARRYFDPHDLDPPLRLVARHFRDTQTPDGSWRYVQLGNDPSKYPTMTAAGLLGLAVGYGLDSEESAKVGKANRDMTADQVLQKGFRALAKSVGNPGEDVHSPPEIYFLWSVERVAVLYQLTRINGKDWYRWGLQILTTTQQNDGKWDLKHGPGATDIVDTCFALLFLQRANLAQDLTDKIEALAAMLSKMHQKD